MDKDRRSQQTNTSFSVGEEKDINLKGLELTKEQVNDSYREGTIDQTVSAPES